MKNMSIGNKFSAKLLAQLSSFLVVFLLFLFCLLFLPTQGCCSILFCSQLEHILPLFSPSHNIEAYFSLWNHKECYIVSIFILAYEIKLELLLFLCFYSEIASLIRCYFSIQKCMCQEKTTLFVLWSSMIETSITEEVRVPVPHSGMRLLSCFFLRYKYHKCHLFLTHFWMST